MHPVVHFTLVTHTAPSGTWPFTAQLAEIRENSNGLSGAGEPPQDTYLMVQVDVTSAITARTVPVPKLRVACHAPHEHGWAAGQITVLTELPVAPELDPTTDGWVTFNSSLGANNLQAPASTYTQCTISLARWHWPTRTAMWSDWNMFCLTVVHEMGHLLGHPHSLVPGSVMAPVFTDESNVPPICRAERPRPAR